MSTPTRCVSACDCVKALVGIQTEAEMAASGADMMSGSPAELKKQRYTKGTTGYAVLSLPGHTQRRSTGCEQAVAASKKGQQDNLCRP